MTLKILVFFILVFLSPFAVFAQPPAGTPPNGPWHDWFVAQKQIDGVTACCGDEASKGGDGHFVEVKHEGDKYLVHIEGHWVPYPLTVDPDLLNPTGRAVVWYLGSYPNLRFYCLRLPTGT